MKIASPAKALDVSAIGLSGLCLIHCLVLPAVSVALPFIGGWSQAEWVHLVFIALAAPISVVALFRRGAPRPSAALLALAASGLALLLFGALGWPSHDLETWLSIAGGLTLTAAHTWNLRRSPPPPCSDKPSAA
ncbi:MerC domain-containing protein [Caulobacter segnis]|uniref:MerC domain-containing protein n=1 Tax=Caulobacter segnis TaxID=88688 RepID=UPI00240F742C|nr:MerC domain-containing protein [Caulobacter segnis]MDG2522108.1 MerC domain-containing protein [Caulobacter segnis]